jgi:hypothetical protein
MIVREPDGSRIHDGLEGGLVCLLLFRYGRRSEGRPLHGQRNRHGWIRIGNLNAIGPVGWSCSSRFDGNRLRRGCSHHAFRGGAASLEPPQGQPPGAHECNHEQNADGLEGRVVVRFAGRLGSRQIANLHGILAHSIDDGALVWP